MTRRILRKLLAASVLTLLAGGLAFSGHVRPSFADDTSVSINNFAFNPDPITINAGDTITWSNDQNVPHTVTSDDGSYDLGTLNPGDTISLTYASSGTYTYHCNIHPSMHGTITVVDSGAPAASGG